MPLEFTKQEQGELDAFGQVYLELDAFPLNDPLFRAYKQCNQLV